MTYIRAVIFDMDGTLTVPELDFPEIRADLGISKGAGILESLASMKDSSRVDAEARLHKFELAAAEASRLNDGVEETLAELDRLGVKCAILTNNSRECTRMILERHSLSFDTVVTREDCRAKPDPDGVHKAADELGFRASRCAMVGDFDFDIRAGRAAGAVTVLYAPFDTDFQTVPDYEIRKMPELIEIITNLNEV